MMVIGMIFQYDSAQGEGLLMFSDGEKKEFSQSDWADTENTPAVGQKVSYVLESGSIQIKLANDKDITKLSYDTKTKYSMDDYIDYFTGQGFKLLTDTQDSGTRTVKFRIFKEDEHSEAIVQELDSKATVKLTRNGKLATFNHDVMH